MKQLIVHYNSIYKVDDIKYFKFSYGNITYRDINCDLSKEHKYILEIICKYCELEFNKDFKKSHLLDLIANSNYLVLN